MGGDARRQLVPAGPQFRQAAFFSLAKQGMEFSQGGRGVADGDDIVMEGDWVLNRGRHNIILRPEGTKEVIQRDPVFPARPVELGVVIRAGSAVHDAAVL